MDLDLDLDSPGRRNQKFKVAESSTVFEKMMGRVMREGLAARIGLLPSLLLYLALLSAMLAFLSSTSAAYVLPSSPLALHASGAPARAEMPRLMTLDEQGDEKLVAPPPF